ncbi:MAG: family 43 glycosylhydrolase [Sporichthyaceae bacterium]|nr:family 43 glycosylhydrolase [Sporichthyaceae bacterium]
MLGRRQIACVLVAAVAAVLPAGTSAAADPEGSTPYVNPVSQDFADTFADPAVIRGKDGWWYSYGTSDPLREGENVFHRIPMARSDNLVDWEYVGDAFSDATMPSWADTARGASIWAPDIRYVDGQYRMYYVVTETRPPGGTDERFDNAIGMATAPTPVGPWTDSGGPVVGPRRVGPDNFTWTFDPSAVTDTDGSQWLFYGSYYGGVWVARLSADGRRAVGDPTMVAIDNKFEGSYVVRRGDYWYFFGSVANCCAGPTTGYSVHVGRSRDLRGPYVDREGIPLLASRAGGTPTLVQNGNRWIAAGHNAVVTDLAGQDWIAYHALGRDDPWLDEPGGINERPMLLDRLDWVDGWPYVRADLGPSDDQQQGPVTDGAAFTRFEQGITAPFRTQGRWTIGTDPQSGRYAEALRNRSTITAPVPEPGAVRAEADVRGAAGLVLGEPTTGPRIQVWVDSEANMLRAKAVGARGAGDRNAHVALPESYRPQAWHSLVVELRSGRLHAELSHARLGDPLAVLDLVLPAGADTADEGGAIARKKGADVDNLSVLRAHQPVTELVQEHVPGTLSAADSDEFDGTSYGAGWTFVDDTRGNPDPTVTGGELVWPVEDTDLNGPANDAGLLLRAPPSQTGNWAVETRLTIDTGENEVLNYQQGGIVAYVDDDLFTRLSHVAIWNTRQTEFGKELRDEQGVLRNGGTIAGPPGATTYLRIVHRFDEANAEHELRAWTKREGGTWVKGGVWTLPGDTTIQVGLISHGRQMGETKTSRFDYFRTYVD